MEKLTTTTSASLTGQWRKFALAAGGLALGFSLPLWQLFQFSQRDELHSYIPLLPLVCAYMIWVDKKNLPAASVPAPLLGIIFSLAGLLVLVGRWCIPTLAIQCSTLAFLLLLTGAGCWWLGRQMMSALSFPLALTLFMVPFPPPLRAVIEYGLQHGSALVANWFFILAGTPVFCQGTFFQLPGMSLQVAPECSGIHSTLVLLITSLVAGKMFLRSPRNRTVLVLVVVPLALLRNGFRILVIGELCVHISPQMIDSPIHHHGGPLFFVLSLVPFFLLLYYLRKTERAGTTVRSQPLVKVK